jgi:hypothetical protein
VRSVSSSTWPSLTKFCHSLVILLPLLARSLTLNVPTGVTSGGSVTFTWATTTGDPTTFSLFLRHPAFNDDFAIANNVQTSLGTLTLSIPIVNPT